LSGLSKGKSGKEGTREKKTADKKLKNVLRQWMSNQWGGSGDANRAIVKKRQRRAGGIYGKAEQKKTRGKKVRRTLGASAGKKRALTVVLKYEMEWKKDWGERRKNAKKVGTASLGSQKKEPLTSMEKEPLLSNGDKRVVGKEISAEVHPVGGIRNRRDGKPVSGLLY